MPRSPPPSVRRRALAKLLCHSAVASLLLAGCRSVDGTWGLPPFFEVYSSPSTFGITGGGGADASDAYFRPFGSVERRPDGSRRWRFFLPLVFSDSGARESRFQITPVFLHRRIDEGDVRDEDWMVFPFLYWGQDSKEGAYAAFFPFGGTLKGLLGQEEIEFWAFPAYAALRSKGRTSVHVLWPLFNWVEGGGWSGARYLNLFSDYRWDNPDGSPRSRRTSIVWPFYIEAHELLDRDPTDIVFWFPFYGKRENSRSRSRTYFWPFYVENLDKKTGKTLVGGYFFPYRFSDEQQDYWPFFGEKETTRSLQGGAVRQRYRSFFLWPLHRYEWALDSKEETSRLWILPLFWRFEKRDAATGRTELRWKLWPLASVREVDPGGELGFDVFSPLWFNREEYERAYGRLAALFRYRSDASRTAWELLFGTVFWETRAEGSVFSLLGGLVEWESSGGGFGLRLFYLPWR